MKRSDPRMLLHELELSIPWGEEHEMCAQGSENP
eukprot:CAMPEP_0182564378 /NCGR_PEP_ID=MMETSP1324-20130603/6340_1 /TAXON_ID=236786 /ORGANISM="Florenciella sp., Strain RCC1587" /LENGTH=33 /DNA_ID= /DNA_START= /DNA_END= /DNA_ORIENTATION=